MQPIQNPQTLRMTRFSRLCVFNYHGHLVLFLSSKQLPPTRRCRNVSHFFDGFQKQSGTGGGWHPALSTLVSLLLLLQGLKMSKIQKEEIPSRMRKAEFEFV